MTCIQCDTELIEEEIDPDSGFGGMCADCFAELEESELEDQLDALL